MSSENRFELLQQILEAKYDFETCDEPLRGESLKRYEDLLDQAITATDCSRSELVEALRFKMHDYRRSRKLQERRRHSL